MLGPSGLGAEVRAACLKECGAHPAGNLLNARSMTPVRIQVRGSLLEGLLSSGIPVKGTNGPRDCKRPGRQKGNASAALALPSCCTRCGLKKTGVPKVTLRRPDGFIRRATSKQILPGPPMIGKIIAQNL